MDADNQQHHHSLIVLAAKILLFLAFVVAGSCCCCPRCPVSDLFKKDQQNRTWRNGIRKPSQGEIAEDGDDKIRRTKTTGDDSEAGGNASSTTKGQQWKESSGSVFVILDRLGNLKFHSFC
jgi:hypothetical protein